MENLISNILQEISKYLLLDDLLSLSRVSSLINKHLKERVTTIINKWIVSEMFGIKDEIKKEEIISNLNNPTIKLFFIQYKHKNNI